MPDNIGSMFYYGECPWHGKGTKLKQPATADEALRAGNLDWDVGLIPIATAENPPSPITRRMAVVRSDRQPGDSSRVVGVVHPGFHPLQNREGIKIFDALIGRGKRVYHTGGYLGTVKSSGCWRGFRQKSKLTTTISSSRTCSSLTVTTAQSRLISA